MKIEIQIEIKSTEVEEKTVKSHKDGKDYLIRSQSAWIDLGKAYPQEIRISLEVGQPAYPKGMYLLDPKCLYVDRYGNLALGRARLLASK